MLVDASRTGVCRVPTMNVSSTCAPFDSCLRRHPPGLADYIAFHRRLRSDRVAGIPWHNDLVVWMRRIFNTRAEWHWTCQLPVEIGAAAAAVCVPAHAPPLPIAHDALEGCFHKEEEAMADDDTTGSRGPYEQWPCEYRRVRYRIRCDY